jgi:hypothetical protein
MKRSPALTAFPNGVMSVRRPDAVWVGTVNETVVKLAKETWVGVTFTVRRLLASVLSKLSPLTLAVAPGEATAGAKPVIDGGADAAAETVIGPLLVADPEGVVTVTAPDVAPAGTHATNRVDVAVVTVPARPLNVTVFWLGTALNPVPPIVIQAPGAAWVGSSMSATVEEGCRVIERRLPTAS